MAGFSDLLMNALQTLEDGRKLNPLDREQLRQYAQTVGDASLILKTWDRGDRVVGDSFVNFPFYPIYSQTLEQDTASVTIQVPAAYEHLWIMGQGRVTAANGGNVWCQLNGDTASNYAWTLISGNGSAAGSAEDTSDDKAALGLFSNTGDPAGSASSFDARIMNYNSAFHQMILANTYYHDNTTRTLYQMGSKWANVAAITSIEVFATNNTLAKGSTSMAEGSVLSIYGMK